MKELHRLSQLGHGSIATNGNDSEFGASIWEYQIPGLSFSIFESGLTYVRGIEKHRIRYRDILGVVSSMTTKVLSAAQSSGSHVSLPLKIKLASGDCDLRLPLVVYSAVLIAIQNSIQRRDL